MDKLFDADAEFKARPATPCVRLLQPHVSRLRPCARVCVCVSQVKPKAQQSSGLLSPKKGNGDWVMKTLNPNPKP